jgi:hypothetical protein
VKLSNGAFRERNILVPVVDESLYPPEWKQFMRWKEDCGLYEIAGWLVGSPTGDATVPLVSLASSDVDDHHGIQLASAVDKVDGYTGQVYEIIQSILASMKSLLTPLLKTTKVVLVLVSSDNEDE